MAVTKAIFASVEKCPLSGGGKSIKRCRQNWRQIGFNLFTMDVQSLLASPMAVIRQAVVADGNLDFMRAIDLYEEGMMGIQDVISTPAVRA